MKLSIVVPLGVVIGVLTGAVVVQYRMIVDYRVSSAEMYESLMGFAEREEVCHERLMHAVCDDFCSKFRLPPQNVVFTASGQSECRCGIDPEARTTTPP